MMSSKYLKRIVSALLSTVLVFMCVTPIYAQYSVETASLWVSDASLYEEIITGTVGGDLPHTSAMFDNIVQYWYTMDEDTEEGTNVILNFTIASDSGVLNFNVMGTVDSCPYGEHVYYEGKLEGTKQIAGNEYDVVVGFQKLSNSSNVRAGIVLKACDIEQESLMLSFGNNVLSYFEREDYIAQHIPVAEEEEICGEENTVMPLAAGDSYSILCSQYISISDPISLANAGNMRFDFASVPLRGILSVKSNCAGIENAYRDLYFGRSVKVNYLKIGIRRISGNGYIAGFEEDIFIPNSSFSIDRDFREGIALILTWLSDAASAIAPSFFIDWVSESLTGDVETTGGTSYKQVEYYFDGIFDEVVLDDGHLPVTYQFNKGEGGTSRFECYSVVEYKCSMLDDYANSSIFYLESDEETYTFSFTRN